MGLFSGLMHWFDRRRGERLVRDGMSAHSNGNHELAVEYLELAKDFPPGRYDSDMVATLLGNAYCELGRVKESIEAHRLAVKINPKNYQAWVNMGVAYRSERNFHEAGQCYFRALDLQPDYVEAYISLSTLNVAMNEPAKSVKLLDKAIEIDPVHPVAHGNLAFCLAMIGLYQEAEVRLERSIALGYSEWKTVRRRIDALSENDPDYDPLEVGDWELKCPDCHEETLSHPNEDRSGRPILCPECGFEMSRIKPAN